MVNATEEQWNLKCSPQTASDDSTAYTTDMAAYVCVHDDELSLNT